MKEIINEEIKNLINNIVQIRKEYGLSKKKMAKTLGISIKTLRKIENGEFPPNLSVEVIFEIYDNFEITPKELFKRRFDTVGEIHESPEKQSKQ